MGLLRLEGARVCRIEREVGHHCGRNHISGSVWRVPAERDAERARRSGTEVALGSR